MNYFFSPTIDTFKSKGSGVEQKSVLALRDRVREIIETENKKKPITDEEISKIMGLSGMPLARRTVSKYRENLGFLSVRYRRDSL